MKDANRGGALLCAAAAWLSWAGPGTGVALGQDQTGGEVGGEAADVQPSRAGESWLFEVTMPGWLPGMEGTLTAAGIPLDVNLGLDDMVSVLDDYLKGIVMLHVEARRGRGFFFGDLVYTDMAGDFEAGATLPPLIQGGPDLLPLDGILVDASGDFDFTMAIVELGGGYRLLDRPLGGEESGRRITVEFIGGARYFYLYSGVNLDLTVALGPIARSAGIGSDGSQDWLDPFAGLQARIDLTEKLSASLRGDVGGFGIGTGFSSDLAWKAQGAIHYAAKPNVQLFAGWEILDVAYDDGGFGWDIQMGGPLMGMSIALGGEHD